MRVALGSDHGGYELKEIMKAWLKKTEHTAIDLGCDSTEPVDYPDYAVKVARLVATGDADFGILACGTGIGMAMAANKVRGVRAAVVNDAYCAEYARAHNDANIMTIGARVVDEAAALRLMDIFLTSSFEGGRHTLRVAKIMAIENDWGK